MISKNMADMITDWHKKATAYAKSHEYPNCQKTS